MVKLGGDTRRVAPEEEGGVAGAMVLYGLQKLVLISHSDRWHPGKLLEIVLNENPLSVITMFEELESSVVDVRI